MLIKMFLFSLNLTYKISCPDLLKFRKIEQNIKHLNFFKLSSFPIQKIFIDHFLCAGTVIGLHVNEQIKQKNLCIALTF